MDEHEGDWQNLGEQGHRRYLGNDQVVYRSRSGTFSAADQAGWLEGIYADEAAAVEALRLAQTDAYPALAEMVHWSQRGQGDDYRPVAVADLAALPVHPADDPTRED
jgi:hypothetical protein